MWWRQRRQRRVIGVLPSLGASTALVAPLYCKFSLYCPSNLQTYTVYHQIVPFLEYFPNLNNVPVLVNDSTAAFFAKTTKYLMHVEELEIPLIWSTLLTPNASDLKLFENTVLIPDQCAVEGRNFLLNTETW